MKYRKKPVVIEAWQIPENIDRTAELPPVWLVDAIMKGTVVPDKVTGCVHVLTLEGSMLGNKLDWIIKGVKGELYPCKPDIFAASYEIDTEVKL
jgi:hypothetical protein